MMEKIRNYVSTLSETITVTRLDGLLAALAAVLAGCVVGMIISPRKNKTFGCGRCHRYFYREEDECEEE